MTADPRDQADGFHGGADDAWELIFALDRLSDKAEWDRLRGTLKDYPGDVPYHDFSAKAFCRAAAAGARDILETMTAKKFALPADEGAKLIEYLVRERLPQAARAIGFLLETGHDAAPAVLSIAQRGTPAMMDALKNQGCDVRGSAILAASLRGNNTAMLQYLCNKGSDLYAAGAVGELPHVREETRRFYSQLVISNTFNWTKYYIAVAGDTALDEMREVPFGVKAEDMTLMHVAARAGCADDIIIAALRETKHPLTAGDLLRPDAKGASVLSIMAGRGEAKKLFDTRLWWRKPEDAVKLHAALEALGQKDLVDPAALAADIRQHRLKTLAKGAIRLSRRPR